MEISEETRIKLDEIQSTYVESTKKLLIEEAKKNNPYQVGDIIEDHHEIGKISKLLFYVNTEKRSCSIDFKCERLTKKLKPYKSEETCYIYGKNVRKKH